MYDNACMNPISWILNPAHFISLHILLLILFHYLFLISFSPYLYIYSLVLCFIVFIAFMLFLFYYYFLFFLHFPLSGPSWLTFHYWLYPVWLCMWQIIKNLEPWTLRTYLWVTNQLSANICSNRDIFIFIALPLVDIYISVDTEYLISCLFF